MTQQDEERYSHGRDQNLSGIVARIRDDGPAIAVLPPQDSPPVPPEAPRQSKSGAESVRRGELAPNSPAAPEPSSVRKRNRALAVSAGALGAVVLVGLGVLLGRVDYRAVPSAAQLAPTSDNVNERLRAIGLSVARMEKQIEEIKQPSDTRIDQLQQWLVAAERATKGRISALEEHVDETRRTQSELDALAGRLETIARQIGEAADGQSAARPKDDGAEAPRATPPKSAKLEEPMPVNAPAVGSAEPATGKVSVTARKAEAAQQPPAATVGAGAKGQEIRADQGAEAIPPVSDSASSAPPEAVGVSPASEQASTTADAQGQVTESTAKTGTLSAVPPQVERAANPESVSPGPGEAGEEAQEEAAVQREATGAGEGSDAADLPSPESASAPKPGAPAPSGAIYPGAASEGQLPTTARQPQIAKKQEPKHTEPRPSPTPTEVAVPRPARGGWAINLVAVSSRERAESAQRVYEGKGFPTDVVVLRRSGSRATLFGVGIGGFETREEATAFLPTVRAKLGIKDVWIHQE